jgi:hypothetical protein
LEFELVIFSIILSLRFIWYNLEKDKKIPWVLTISGGQYRDLNDLRITGIKNRLGYVFFNRVSVGLTAFIV